MILGELLAAALHVPEQFAAGDELEDEVEAAGRLESEHELHEERVLRECTYHKCTV